MLLKFTPRGNTTSRHTCAGAPYSRPVPLPPYVSSVFPPSSSPPFPFTHSTLPINFDCVRIHPSRPLAPPPSYLTSLGRSQSYPPCLSGGPFSWRNSASQRVPTPPDWFRSCAAKPRVVLTRQFNACQRGVRAGIDPASPRVV